MKTSIYTEKNLIEIVNILSKDDIIAFPTETVFGLAANAYSDTACQKIYNTKKRPHKNPLIAHIRDLNHINIVAKQCPQWAYDLFEYFSPGPLTIILEKSPLVCATATAGLSTVAIRIPSHPIAQKLLNACPFPLVAPSANQSGRPSPTSTKMVMAELQGLISAVLDGKPSLYGIESTIIGKFDEKVLILRPGTITSENLAHILGYKPDLYQPLKSNTMHVPGNHYPHYQPNYPIYLIKNSKIPLICLTYKNENCGLFVLENSLTNCASLPPLWKKKTFKDVQEYTKNFYKELVNFESQKIIKLFAEIPQNSDCLGLCDRLYRAANQKEI